MGSGGTALAMATRPSIPEGDGVLLCCLLLLTYFVADVFARAGLSEAFVDLIAVSAPLPDPGLGPRLWRMVWNQASRAISTG
jgi:hypothetical protein